jgi:hypothetical protein
MNYKGTLMYHENDIAHGMKPSSTQSASTLNFMSLIEPMSTGLQRN